MDSIDPWINVTLSKPLIPEVILSCHCTKDNFSLVTSSIFKKNEIFSRCGKIGEWKEWEKEDRSKLVFVQNLPWVNRWRGKFSHTSVGLLTCTYCAISPISITTHWRWKRNIQSHSLTTVQGCGCNYPILSFTVYELKTLGIKWLVQDHTALKCYSWASDVIPWSLSFLVAIKL